MWCMWGSVRREQNEKDYGIRLESAGVRPFVRCAAEYGGPLERLVPPPDPELPGAAVGHGGLSDGEPVEPGDVAGLFPGGSGLVDALQPPGGPGHFDLPGGDLFPASFCCFAGEDRLRPDGNSRDLFPSGLFLL